MNLKTGLQCLAYFAVLLAVVIAGDRLLTQRLYAQPDRLVPAYRSFNEPSVGIKLRDLSTAKERFDPLVLGNSRTYSALDPEPFDRRLAALGVRAESFNLAMPTVDVRFWPPFLERFYDRAAPRDVLLGVIPRDFDARNVVAEQQAKAFEASPGFANRDRTAVWKAAEEALAGLFALRGRGNEIRPRRLLRGRKLDARGFRLAGDHGWGIFDPSRVVPKPELATKARLLAQRSGSIRLRVGASQLAALARLDRLVRARGGCLTLFTTPLLYDREPLGTVEVQRDFQRLLRRIAREHPAIGVVDVGPEVQDRYGLGDFADGDHLSPAGARRFSRELADALAPRLRDRSCGGGVSR